jgi:hypothetical protein
MLHPQLSARVERRNPRYSKPGVREESQSRPSSREGQRGEREEHAFLKEDSERAFGGLPCLVHGWHRL